MAGDTNCVGMGRGALIIEQRSLRRNFARRFWNQTYPISRKMSELNCDVFELDFMQENYLYASLAQADFRRLQYEIVWILAGLGFRFND